MASNILTTAAFTTTNMKPVPDEQIDALWGQNIADNVGFLYGRQFPHYYNDFVATVTNVYTGGITKVLATTIMDRPFLRIPGHNTLVATMTPVANHYGSNPAMTYDNQGTMTWGIYGNLGTYMGTVAYSQANTASYSLVSLFATTIDLSAVVSVGSWARYQMTASGTTTDPDTTAAPFGNMVWEMRDIKMYSKWG